MARGITITEATEGVRALPIVATAVIGLVVTAPAADVDDFPLDKPVLVLDPSAALEAAGATGTLRASLQAIADHVRAPVVVVRVAPGADQDGTDDNVIGTDVAGVKTGMQALLAAKAAVGFQPRIIGAPGLDTQAVTTAMAIVAKKLRARAYAAAIGDDVSEAIAYRENFSARELMLITPDFKVPGGTSQAVARALGLRAQIDKTVGFHKTLSNVPVMGVTGLTKDYAFDPQDPDCEVNLLNAAGITSLIHYAGAFRFWGNRTCSDDPKYAFESTVGTAHAVMDTIADGVFRFIDKPLKPSLARDIVETINAMFDDMVLQGKLLGGRCRFDPEDNPVTSLQVGQLRLAYEFTDVPPLEHLGLTQSITGTYLADFAAGMAG